MTTSGRIGAFYVRLPRFPLRRSDRRPDPVLPATPSRAAWTVADLQERMAADWVELDGFLVADDPDGPGLIGACWTKIHRDRTPPLGEIYVIDVDPRHHGQGWGRSLTVAGLVYLAGTGITVGMLYTDASNVAAVALYRSLGFTVDHVDRSYRRDPPGSASQLTPLPMARPTPNVTPAATMVTAS